MMGEVMTEQYFLESLCEKFVNSYIKVKERKSVEASSDVQYVWPREKGYPKDTRPKYFRLKKRKNRKRPDTREEKEWNNFALRTVHFDERFNRYGVLVTKPRIVTCVYTYNKDTGVMRYGAVQWTPSYSKDRFIRSTQRDYANQRFVNDPVIVKFDPTPENNYDTQSYLRSALFDLGVCGSSRRGKRFVPK